MLVHNKSSHNVLPATPSLAAQYWVTQVGRHLSKIESYVNKLGTGGGRRRREVGLPYANCLERPNPITARRLDVSL